MTQAVKPGDIVHLRMTGENLPVVTADEAGNFTYCKSYRAFGGPEVEVRLTGNAKDGSVQIIRRLRPKD
ncbi:hypothetical protein [Sinorhizobium meliloti]|uniref:hypothetical protein n=1 Tax=Rhizobium meliloti TaxID=382 RepID=UPI000FDC9924|nr:hypothetical protein [Sinorhizobium meliloti]RVI65329.1 hypothetical protein CN189_11965 [Sinorhizobium meliloti]